MVLLAPKPPQRLRPYLVVLCSWLLTAILAGCSAPLVASTPTPTPRPTLLPTSTPDPDVVQFANGHTVRGAFRRFWQATDGATYFGAPLTAAHWVDGRTVQYFERARFELDLDGAVQLAPLGAHELARQGDQPEAAQARSSCEFVAATRHNVCGGLRELWERAQNVVGAPLTEAVRQDSVLVQYFERARLEQPRGQAARLANLGDAALSRVPAHLVLRVPSHLPAAQPAQLRSDQSAVQPLQTVRAVLETDNITGTATLFWGDTAGRMWATNTPLVAGRAEVEHVARGALGAQGAVVLIDGKVAGVSSAVFQLDAASAIMTGQPRFDELLPRVKAFMDQDISTYTFGDNVVRGYRSPDNNLLWLRDHVHQAKGYAYWEQDMTSLLDQFRRYQHADGSFDDYLGVFDYGEVRGRKEVEADLEYLFIEGVYRAWQATGDDRWLRRQLPAMEHGLRYAMTDSQRWDPTHRLVKRPYTIDTWDFEIGPPTVSPDGKPAPRHWIDANTKWSIFHGDNTGYAQAMELLARMYTHLGDPERASYWRDEGRGLIERLNALAWNGRFFRHMVPLVPLDLTVDTEQQLSLSNAYALNRGVLTGEQADAILDEYQSRRRSPDQAFAEWYSIDPPFPEGVSSIPPWQQGHRPGEYVNGGIMPLVGGELAQGAFRFGHEAYGFDILQRYHSLIAGTGASFLWYHPLGQPGISGADTLPTDGWGASAMLAALVEGAAGVQDQGTAFSTAILAPRWSGTPDVQHAEVVIRYGASAGYVAYRWERTPSGVRLQWTGSGQHVGLHLLLPAEAPDVVQVMVNGQTQAVPVATVGGSRYLDVERVAADEVVVNW